MNIESILKKEGIEIISELDKSIVHSICKNIARRIVETFPKFNLDELDLFNKLNKLTMYKAKMIDGMAEANYFYKNTSIYFNEDISDEDLEEFAIHECLHYLQEIKDSKNNLKRMGLCNYKNSKPIGLGLNEAAVQYTTSLIIGIDGDFEKYYNIEFFTPSPSYYPLECALLNQIIYFTGNESLFRSTMYSNDDFKNEIIKCTSTKTYEKLLSSFDKILILEKKLTKQISKIYSLKENSSKFEKNMLKINQTKQKISKDFIDTQNIIIKDFFDNDFKRITNLEQLDDFRRKLYKFSDIIGNIKGYDFFDNYYIDMMNKLEHKCNILENGGIETAISKKKSTSFFELLYKLLKPSSSKKTVN